MQLQLGGCVLLIQLLDKQMLCEQPTPEEVGARTRQLGDPKRFLLEALESRLSQGLPRLHDPTDSAQDLLRALRGAEMAQTQESWVCCVRDFCLLELGSTRV